ncbi:hypothetical protein SPOG_00722 [Schizosaccharomyces cryophilus OY26]|uniref:Uncharacterized protein n=1 Tax=Schizosaccharomyces cryophilus (strain OY26 / ATCC MYA-4695 / CBS 11777 / NBRC 106824 / NRRL Y48691) TaxID=653667 RepID=S9X113_SCHCR|nr:uncharacterized protein SPOG_00722 [Schizosaccharomyces cryophilus OY26]EPY50737.1 hypothetical protein SPOG_00722 [Schizosaccharomyces cryophilus OY26]
MTDEEFQESLENYYNELKQLSSSLNVPFNLTIFRNLILNNLSEYCLNLKTKLQDIGVKCNKLTSHLYELDRCLGRKQHIENELPLETHYQHLLSLQEKSQREYDSRLQLVKEIQSKVLYQLFCLGENSEGLFLENSPFVDVSDSKIEQLNHLKESIEKKYQSRKEILLNKRKEILPLEKHLSTKIEINTNNLSTGYLERIKEYKEKLDCLVQKKENYSSRSSVHSDLSPKVNSPSAYTSPSRRVNGNKEKEPSSNSVSIKHRKEYESLLKRYLLLAKSLFISKKDLLFKEIIENLKKDDILEILHKLKQEIHNMEVETHLRGEINALIRKYLALEARLYKESQTVKGSSSPSSKPFTLKRLKKDFQLTRANLIYSLRNWEEENERKIIVFGKPLSDRLQFYSYPLQRSSSKKLNVPTNDQRPISTQTNGSQPEMKTDDVHDNDTIGPTYPNRNASESEIGSVKDSVSPFKRQGTENSVSRVSHRNASPLIRSSSKTDVNNANVESLESQVEAQYNHFMSVNNINNQSSMPSPSRSLREMIQPYIPPKGSPTALENLAGSHTQENHLLMSCTKDDNNNSYLGKMSSHEEERLCKRLDSFSFSKDMISKKLRNNIHGLHFSTPTQGDPNGPKD